jgi:hypothetical protein
VTRKQRRQNAVALGRKLVQHSGLLGFGLYGQCQRITRTLLGAPGGEPDATAEWLHSDKSDRHGGRKPPAGVPIYFQGGVHWHAAISTGNGNCLSSDIKRKGGYDEVPITLIEQRWNYPYVGWLEKINGLRIYGSEK